MALGEISSLLGFMTLVGRTITSHRTLNVAIYIYYESGVRRQRLGGVIPYLKFTVVFVRCLVRKPHLDYKRQVQYSLTERRHVRNP